MTGKTAKAPRPELRRKPEVGFGWIDQRMLHDGWLKAIGSDACAVLILLAIAADERGASFYGRARMGSLLGMDLCRIDEALSCLLDLELVAMRPWRQGAQGRCTGNSCPIPLQETQRSGESQKIDTLLEQVIIKKRVLRGRLIHPPGPFPITLP